MRMVNELHYLLSTDLASEKQVSQTCKPHVQCKITHPDDLNGNPIPCFPEQCVLENKGNLLKLTSLMKLGFLLLLGWRIVKVHKGK